MRTEGRPSSPTVATDIAVGSTICGVRLARSSNAPKRAMGSSVAGRRGFMAADLYPTYLAPAMDRWLSRLERRLGRYAPHNLTWWIVGLSGLAYLLLWLKPELRYVLVF